MQFLTATFALLFAALAHAAPAASTTPYDGTLFAKPSCDATGSTYHAVGNGTSACLVFPVVSVKQTNPGCSVAVFLDAACTPSQRWGLISNNVCNTWPGVTLQSAQITC